MAFFFFGTGVAVIVAVAVKVTVAVGVAVKTGVEVEVKVKVGVGVGGLNHWVGSGPWEPTMNPTPKMISNRIKSSTCFTFPPSLNSVPSL